MLRNFNATSRYVDQGGQKRPGSIAIYLEPWHADIEEFLMLRRNTGNPEERCRDLFYAMWIPDLFMERVEADGNWTLMCPDKCPGLADVWGDKFKELYEGYERENRGMKVVPARKIWTTIIESQIETGQPYILFKDSINRKSNQQNLGTIKSSNLCAEIVEYSAPDEIAVCNLLSVCLPKYLERPVVQEPFKIYSKSACKYCDLSKTMLTRLGYAYTEVNLDDDLARKEFFGKLNQDAISQLNPNGCADGVCEMPVGGLITTVPQIFLGETRIGGYNELREYLKPVFNFKKLREITKMAVRNLNKLIDYNYYPVPETYNSNMRHRPIGIGIQGIADVFAQLRMPFESPEAIEMSRKIAEHMYLAACQASMDIARKRKKHVQDYRRIVKKAEEERTAEERELMQDIMSKHVIHPDELEKLPMALAGAYSSFVGSPASHGTLQFDMWGVEPSPELAEEWSTVKEDIKKHGLRNSLLMAMMPTASTSQIMGNNECIEPFTNNIYKRQTLAGNFTIINKYLVADLMSLGLWNQDMKDKIILQNGSVQGIPEVPDHIKKLYKTVWEIKQKAIVDHARARSPFICQTQSMNLFFEDLSYSKINTCHFYSWKSGLKTGMYYLRSKAKTQAQKFSVDASKIVSNTAAVAASATKYEEEGCLNCSA
jgi:ribonucleotide reductase alpha subunit